MALVELTHAPEPLLRQIEVIEVERAQLADRLAGAEAEAAERAALNRITEHEVRRVLVDHAARIEKAAPDAMRAAFADLLSRVELDGDMLRAHYKIVRPAKVAPNLRDKVASPRGFEPRCPP